MRFILHVITLDNTNVNMIIHSGNPQPIKIQFQSNRPCSRIIKHYSLARYELTLWEIFTWDLRLVMHVVNTCKVRTKLNARGILIFNTWPTVSPCRRSFSLSNSQMSQSITRITKWILGMFVLIWMYWDIWILNAIFGAI